MRVLLADDQAKVRSALRLLLEHQPDVEILGEAVDTTGLLDWVKVACPDLVLLDWELPGLPAPALLPLLHYQCPNLRAIALSSRPEVRQAALEAGADAFASKGDPPERLLAAVHDCCQRYTEHGRAAIDAYDQHRAARNLSLTTGHLTRTSVGNVPLMGTTYEVIFVKEEQDHA